MNFLNLDVNSMYPHVFSAIESPKSFKYVDSSPDSDGVMWYEINVYHTSVQHWIESQPKDLWCESTFTWGQGANIKYLVHESLYTYINLRFA